MTEPTNPAGWRRHLARLALGLPLMLGVAGCEEMVTFLEDQGDQTSDTTPHGELLEIEGQRLLRVWGTPSQMGFAHGHLLRDDIIDVVDRYALEAVPASVIDAAGPIYRTVADVSPELRAEAEGIVEGMKAAGGAEIPGLGRTLTAVDLLVLNAMTDLLTIGCSSLSAWGPATQADEDLAGAPAVVRNLDWSSDPDLLRNQLVIAYEPSDPERQPVVSVAFAGYIGCLSCVNAAGVTALFNMGYGQGSASLWQAAGGFAPANLLVRDALERRDVDGDHTSTAADVEALVRRKRHAGSYMLHVLERSGPDGSAPARVLEVEADGVVTRTPDSATALGPHTLAATNHLRGKEGPQSCERYEHAERESHRLDRQWTIDHLWDLGRELRLRDVVHTLLVEPDSRALTVWLRRPGDAADLAARPVRYEWADLVPAQY